MQRYIQFTIVLVGILAGFLAWPAALLAQDTPTGEQSEHQISAAAARPTWLMTTGADGFTTWKKEIAVSCSYSDHNYTLDIPQEPADLSEISYSMTNYDVDYNDPQGCSGGPEVDHMKFNGRFLGILTGANGSWSINSWPLNQSDIISGSNQIYIDTDAPGTGCWCVGVGYIEVKAKLGFKITEKTPQEDDKNRDFHAANLDLKVSFTKEYDPATLNSSTFKLEYRNQAGAWQSQAGSFAQLSPQQFRFVPSADLKDGVRYRVTVVSGDTGIKSSEGAKLDSDAVWYFWTVPDLNKTDAFDYGSGSVCPPSTSPCQGLEPVIFQVARNAKMVPGKEAVGRIYIRWKKHDDVHADDQVIELNVDVKLAYGGASSNQAGTVKRPDKYGPGEKVTASNTINIKHTPAGPFDYNVEVTPKPQTNSTPVKYTNSLTLDPKGNAPSIQFPYYFLKDGDWAGGVPAASKTGGVALMTSGVKFVTDQFPVLGTTFDQKGDYSIGYITTTTTVNAGNCGIVKVVDCPGWFGSTTPKAELNCAYEKLQTLRGGFLGIGASKFAAATVPNGLCVGATAFAISGDVFMHQDGTGANEGTVAHEIGHLYGISPANNPTNAHRNDSSGVEGFQVRTGTNKSFVENPTASISLMHTTLQPLDTQWVDNTDYNTLLSSVNMLSQQTAAATEYLIVAGEVNTATNSGELLFAFRQDTPNDAANSSGPCRVELLDGNGAMLAEDWVTPGIEIEPYVQMDSGAIVVGETFNLQAAGDDQFFTVSLPWNDAAQSLQVSCNNTVLLTVNRTAEAPVVDFTNLPDGSSLSDQVALEWNGSDTDGPGIAYQLQVYDSANGLWVPLTPLGSNLSYTLNSTLLSSGANQQLRIMATDGLNSSYSVRTVNIVNALTVLGVLPGVNGTNAGLKAPVSALFVTPLATPTVQSGVFSVIDSNFQYLEGVLTYDAPTRALNFTPSRPLNPGSTYTARIETSLQDVNGNYLAVPYEWSFTTVADTLPPVVMQTHPEAGALDTPLNTLLQVRFDAPMDSLTLTDATFLLVDSSANSVTGTVTYDANRNAAIFIPNLPLAANTLYTARITTAVKDVAGNALAAMYEWSFETGVDSVQNGLRIIGNFNDQGVDNNRDGLFEQLRVQVDVEVQVENYYNLNTRLIDQRNQLIQWTTSGDLYLTRGIHTIDLIFDGAPIYSNGANGPYIVELLNFYRTSNPSEADQLDRSYRTFAYTVSQFYGLLSFGSLPNQLLKTGTVRDNAFNMRDFTTHRTLPVSDVVYAILVNTDPAVNMTIDADANIDINPAANVQAESDVTIEATDSLGNRALSTFHISVQQPRISNFAATLPSTMTTNSTLPIAVELRDQFGELYTQPTTFNVKTTLAVADVLSATTSSGIATINLTAENTPGIAFVTFSLGPASTLYNIEIVPLGVGSVLLDGPITGIAGMPYQFTATAGPAGVTRPVSFTWEASTLTSTPGIGLIASSTTFTWTQAGPQTLKVTADNGFGSTQSLHTIQIAPAAPSVLVAQASPQLINSDGVSTSTIRVQVFDQFNNPVTGQEVTFATTLGTITPSSLTGADGIATATLTSAQQVGPARVTAAIGALSAAAEVTFAGQVFGGSIFVDVNQNGVRESSEPGIASAVVEMSLQVLAAGAEQAVATPLEFTVRTTSDGQGNYAFADLPLGTYRLTVQLPSGFTETEPTTLTVTVGPGQPTAALEIGALARMYLPSLSR